MNVKVLGALILISSFIACTKTEGEGGAATIKGKVFVRDLDNDGDLKAEFYGPERDVYIVYGDDDFYSDNIKTHYDGSFKFEFLRPGNYQVFAYTECSTCNVPIMPVIVDTMIVEDEQIVDLGDIVVEE